MTFLILINDYLLKATGIPAEAASFGITIIGEATFCNPVFYKPC